MPKREYRIASDEQILDALKKVLARRRMIDSQRSLKKLVEAQIENDFRVGEVRLRHLAIESRLINLETICRESPLRKALVKCPVCDYRLNKVRNLTVFGGTVTLGYKCKKCGYWSGLRKRIPTRYIFTRRK